VTFLGKIGPDLAGRRRAEALFSAAFRLQLGHFRLLFYLHLGVWSTSECGRLKSGPGMPFRPDHLLQGRGL